MNKFLFKFLYTIFVSIILACVHSFIGFETAVITGMIIMIVNQID